VSDPQRTARQAEMLAGRLKKNARHLARWAAREGVGCYRLYDRDIPEVPLTIDRYDADLVVAAWDRFPAGHAGERGDEDPAWLPAMLASIAHTLGVAPERIHARVRRRQKGLAQYERVAERGERIAVGEGGLRFWVNLDDYLDTGLFLDHRWARARVRAEAAGKRVLNLFCYTGAFTVYAAAGGAAATTSVDLSATYLAWAADNLALNQLADPRHELVRADVLAWLEQPSAARHDIIVLDPPSFSNSKKMRGVLDLDRDHPFLIGACLQRLAPGGVLYFSTNHRSLKLAIDGLGDLAIDDLTRPSIPPDIRDGKIHRLWQIRRADEVGGKPTRAVRPITKI
jgi:23S rRNA G2069 N7-methylase RlmK/C1962 C5-methylase RlmI